MSSPRPPARPRRRAPTAPATAVLAALRPRSPASPSGPLPPGDARVLRLGWLDARILVTVVDRLLPRDLLQSPQGRMRALSHLVPDHAVLMGRAALWVHAGGEPPDTALLSIPTRTRLPPGALVSRALIDPADITTVDGRACTSVARSAVDLARTAEPRVAVEAVAAAYRAGAGEQSLHLALSHCRGACARGRPRARRIIEQLAPTAGAGAPRPQP